MDYLLKQSKVKNVALDEIRDKRADAPKENEPLKVMIKKKKVTKKVIILFIHRN